MKITEFDALNVKHFRTELENTLNELATKFGLKVASLGNISYDKNILHTSKLSFAPISNQIPVTAPLQNYVGHKYKHGNRTLTILSVQDGKLLAITNRNARYLITREQIKEMVKLP